MTANLRLAPCVSVAVFLAFAAPSWAHDLSSGDDEVPDPLRLSHGNETCTPQVYLPPGPPIDRRCVPPPPPPPGGLAGMIP